MTSRLSGTNASLRLLLKWQKTQKIAADSVRIDTVENRNLLPSVFSATSNTLSKGNKIIFLSQRTHANFRVSPNFSSSFAKAMEKVISMHSNTKQCASKFGLVRQLLKHSKAQRSEKNGKHARPSFCCSPE